MTSTERIKRRAARPEIAASPVSEQGNAEDGVLNAYLAAVRINPDEVDGRRSELLQQAREWQAVQDLRRAWAESKAEVSQEEAEASKAAAAEASTEVAKTRWRAFLAARKAREMLQ
jgi:hypothetical protein